MVLPHGKLLNQEERSNGNNGLKILKTLVLILMQPQMAESHICQQFNLVLYHLIHQLLPSQHTIHHYQKNIQLLMALLHGKQLSQEVKSNGNSGHRTLRISVLKLMPQLMAESPICQLSRQKKIPHQQKMIRKMQIPLKDIIVLFHHHIGMQIKLTDQEGQLQVRNNGKAGLDNWLNMEIKHGMLQIAEFHINQLLKFLK